MGSSIDVSSTGQLVNRLMNPPDMGAQFAKGLETLNAWKQYQAKAAEGVAYRQSVDPQTGAIDLGKYNALLSQSPAGAWNFGAAAQQAGQAVGQQGLGTQQDVKAKLDQMSALQAYMGPLYDRIQNKQPVTGQDVLNAMNTAPPGLATPELRAQLNQQVQSVGGPTGDASGIVMGGYFANQQAMDMLKMRFPNFGAINAGNVIYPTQANPIYPGRPGAAGGVQYPSQGMPMGPSPDLMSKDVTVTLPGGGALQNVPYWQAQAMERDPSLVHYYYPNVPTPTGPVTIAPQPGTAAPGGAGVGHYPAPVPAAPAAAPSAPGAAPAAAPSASAPPTAPSFAQPPPPPPQGAGGVGVTPSPSYVETVAKPSSAAATELTEQFNNTTQTMPLLDDMQSKLASGQLTTGVGSTVMGTLRGLMQRLKLSPTTPAGAVNTADPQAMQDEFAKDAALLQAAQLRTLGRPTDARLELAQETNHGMLLSTYGNLGIVNMLRGNQLAIRAEGNAWSQAQRAGWDPTRFNEWQSQHFLQSDPATGGRFDPRMFWISSMAPLEQRKYIADLPQDQQTQLGKNRDFAIQMGWVVQRPDGTFLPGQQ